MATLLQIVPGVVVGGDFRVIEPLSAGGMGALYVVEQLSTGKRRALKVMHRQLLRDATLRERFTREARVGALIESDHVVEVIAAGIEEPTGVPWIVMELLQGRDLADHLADTGRLSLSETVTLLRQLCHALAAAHRAGVVHRDVKPENVFLAEARSATSPITVKVLDFGIAKVLAQARATGTVAVGSPAWMAPEQTEAGTRVGPPADVWALGLLTFWALTGKSYWRTANEPEGSVHALMREVLFEPLEPASARADAIGAASDLPDGFDTWFARCVARAPGDRFENAARAFAELEVVALAAGLPPLTPTPLSVTHSAQGAASERVSTIPISSGIDPANGRASVPSVPSPDDADISSDAPSKPAARSVAPTVDDPLALAQPASPPAATVAAAPAWREVAPQLSGTAAALVTGRANEEEGATRLPLRSRTGSIAGLLAVAALFLLSGLWVIGPQLGPPSAKRNLEGAAVPSSWELRQNEAEGAQPRQRSDDGERTVERRSRAALPKQGPEDGRARSSTDEPDERETGTGPAHARRHSSSRSAATGTEPATAPPTAVAGTPTLSPSEPGELPPGSTTSANPSSPAATEPTTSSRPAPGGPPDPPGEAAAASTAAPTTGGDQPAPEPRRPFDRAAAQSQVHTLAEVARQSCSSFVGPRTVTAEVVFRSTGRVRHVVFGERDQRGGTTVGCVRILLHEAQVPPFDGADERVAVVIALP